MLRNHPFHGNRRHLECIKMAEAPTIFLKNYFLLESYWDSLRKRERWTAELCVAGQPEPRLAGAEYLPAL